MSAGRAGSAGAAGNRNCSEAAGVAARRTHLSPRRRVNQQVGGVADVSWACAACLQLLLLCCRRCRGINSGKEQQPATQMASLPLPRCPCRVERVLKSCGAALVWVSHDPGQPGRVGGRVLSLPLGNESAAVTPPAGASPSTASPAFASPAGTVGSTPSPEKQQQQKQGNQQGKQAQKQPQQGQH
jgi:hypothetical protein